MVPIKLSLYASWLVLRSVALNRFRLYVLDYSVFYLHLVLRDTKRFCKLGWMELF